MLLTDILGENIESKHILSDPMYQKDYLEFFRLQWPGRLTETQEGAFSMWHKQSHKIPSHSITLYKDKTPLKIVGYKPDREREPCFGSKNSQIISSKILSCYFVYP